MNINSLILLINLLILSLLICPASAEPVDRLVEKAETMGLAAQTDWLNLLHYKSHVFGREQSQADDPAFFMASNGASDASAELVADLRAFFLPVKDEPHAQCRFPARLHWLNRQLDFSHELPAVNCEKLHQWQRRLNAEGVSLLFPSMYLHNPASMFGHTFLRFDNSDTAPLLSYTLSYGAANDADDGPLAYVYKGLSGGYLGAFSVRPYYDTVQEYGDIEHRDIWEYSLNLTTEETAQLIRHAWEVRGIHFDYYFLRENCAYRLLAMLDVARPGLNMSRQSHALYAIPVDTVRDISAAGLVQHRVYRPAQHSRIQQMFRQIDKGMQQQVLAIIDHSIENIKPLMSHYSEQQQVQILELAYEISRFKNNNAELDTRLLNLRSALPAKKDQGYFLFEQAAPETGHASARWYIGVGEKENEGFYELGIRPALHDSLDPGSGFIKGASISSMDTNLRWYKEAEKIRLEKLQFISVQSLLPVQPWNTPLSTAFAVSLQNRVFEDATDHKALVIDASLGYSMSFYNQLWFVLADISYEYADEFDQNYMLSLGGRAGVLCQFENSRLMLELQQLESVSGSEGGRQKILGKYQFEINNNQAIALEYQHEDFDFTEQQTARLRYIKYF